MKRNAKTIEETSEYKIVIENRFDNIGLNYNDRPDKSDT